MKRKLRGGTGTGTGTEESMYNTPTGNVKGLDNFFNTKRKGLFHKAFKKPKSNPNVDSVKFNDVTGKKTIGVEQFNNNNNNNRENIYNFHKVRRARPQQTNGKELHKLFAEKALANLRNQGLTNSTTHPPKNYNKGPPIVSIKNQHSNQGNYNRLARSAPNNSSKSATNKKNPYEYTKLLPDPKNRSAVNGTSYELPKKKHQKYRVINQSKKEELINQTQNNLHKLKSISKLSKIRNFFKQNQSKQPKKTQKYTIPPLH